MAVAGAGAGAEINTGDNKKIRSVITENKKCDIKNKKWENQKARGRTKKQGGEQKNKVDKQIGR